MPRYAVAAGSRLAAEAAGTVLAEGGSAVDAVIAGALAACVAEPVLASLLGGGFLMVREPSGRVRLLDAFVHTPRRPLPERETDLREIVADFGETTQSFHIGAGSIACPGLGPGLAEAHARFGRMPLPDLAAPACAAARAGTPIEAFQATVLGIVAPIYRASGGAKALYLHGRDAPPEAGTPIQNPALADLIETFAHEGARFLQQGEPAAALAALCEQGGHLTLDDLRRYAPVWRTPLEAVRGKARLAFNPAPALGGVMTELMLALLPERAQATAVARMLGLADTARAEAAASREPAAALADPDRRARLAGVLARPQAPRGTTHISAVDAEGMGAALSVSNGEGCGLVLPGMGMMPNNMLGEADLVPEPGRFAADVRLASMMAPTMAQWPDGRFAVLGSGGSTRIPGMVAQVLARIVDEGMPVADAVTAPRLHVHEGLLDIEPDQAPGDVEALRRLWPEARVWAARSMYFGGVHGALRDARGDAFAAGDPRRSGAALAG